MFCVRRVLNTRRRTRVYAAFRRDYDHATTPHTREALVSSIDARVARGRPQWRMHLTARMRAYVETSDAEALSTLRVDYTRYARDSKTSPATTRRILTAHIDSDCGLKDVERTALKATLLMEDCT